MKIGVLVAAVVVSAFAVGTASAQDAKLIAKGQQVYDAQKCGVCHSIGDKGNKKGPLDGVGSKLTEAEIRDWMVKPLEMHKKMKAERKPFMKAYDKLPKDELDAVVAYMMSLKKK